MLPKNLHLIGIGGAGMAGLAQHLVECGHAVSGSDQNPVALAGVTFHHGHQPENIVGAEVIIASDAVPHHNPEILEAKLRNIPVIRRAEALARAAQGKRSVFVAGTHGKSTTSAMIATVLEAAGQNPNYVIGASAPCLDNRRGKATASPLFVAEACEAFQNLSYLRPDIGVITNIDNDHLEHYGSQERLDKAFRDFAARTGRVIVHGDDAGVKRLRLDTVTRFGFGAENDVAVGAYGFDAASSRFEVVVKGKALGTVTLPVPGKPAITNAIACVAVCLSLDIAFETIAAALSHFTGLARRWQDHGLINGIRLVDDYAHHPTALKNAVETARILCRPGQRLVVLFQPQLFSRTQRLYQDFAEVLLEADRAILLATDGGMEPDAGEGHSALIADAIKAHGGAARVVENLESFIDRASDYVSPGDFLLIAGGGGMNGAAEKLKIGLAHPSIQDELDFSSLVPQKPADAPLFSSPKTVLDRFEAHVRKNPAHIALADSKRQLSYAQLNEAAARLAIVLAAHGVKKGEAVGVSLPSSIELIVLMLAIAKQGAVYLPLDASLPPERAGYMLAKAESRMVITARRSSLAKLSNITRLLLSDFQAALDRPAPASKNALTPRDGAYICFTSGSTGYPKGIRITHGSLDGFIGDVIKGFEVTTRTRASLNTSISFDVSLGEIWMTLASGGCLCATESLKPLVGQALADYIRAQRITHLTATPSVMASVPKQDLPTVTHIISVGEALPPELVALWAPGRVFINAYGPTEATIYATIARCEAGKPVTIGKPLKPIRTYIVDDELKATPKGKVGELCLAGKSVAGGYIGNSTSGKFISWHGELIYRTGDMVRQDDDGNLLYLGRRDDQVKIYGNRIELLEIEAALMRLESVKEAAVIAVDNGSRKEIAAFVVHDKATGFDARTLVKQISAWLPDYMVPSRFVPLASIPLNPNGKRDMPLLIQNYKARLMVHAPYKAPRNAVEEKLAAIWQLALESQEPVGVDDEFDAIGGDSLRTLIVIEEIESAFGIAIPPGTFGRFTTITQMALQLGDMLADPAGTDSAEGFKASRIYKQLRDLTSSWGGVRASDESLMVSLGAAKPRYELFVCAQMDEEVEHLARYLGKDFRVHGMRSGHLVMAYSESNIRALAAHYLEEMKSLPLHGEVVLMGICQGGRIAQAMAEGLGRYAQPLILVEQARLLPYAGEVAFFYSDESFLNPQRRFETGMARYDQIYGSRYSLHIMPGAHGRFHVAPSVHSFAEQLQAKLEGAARPLARTG